MCDTFELCKRHLRRGLCMLTGTYQYCNLGFNRCWRTHSYLRSWLRLFLLLPQRHPKYLTRPTSSVRWCSTSVSAATLAASLSAGSLAAISLMNISYSFNPECLIRGLSIKQLIILIIVCMHFIFYTS